MLRCCRFSFTYTHTSCYAAVGSFDNAVDDDDYDDDDAGDDDGDDDGDEGKNDHDDDVVDDDDDVDIAYETKVSFLSLFSSPI